jgi:hypothetical protein
MANKKNRGNVRSRKGQGYLGQEELRNVSNTGRSGKIDYEDRQKGNKNLNSDMDEDRRNKGRGSSERTQR